MTSIHSRQVDWFSVFQFVNQLLATVAPWPAAGTPEWCALPDGDDRKLAAVLEYGVHHALRRDTLQEEMAGTSHEISTIENWNTQRRRMFNHAHRIPRKAS